MLPGIRSVLIAIIAAISLLIGAFGLVATFRVAQESRSGPLRTELAQRSRVPVTANSDPLTLAPVEKPAPLEAIPVRPVTIADTPDIPPLVAAPASQTEAGASEPLAPSEPPAVEPRPAEARSIEPPPAVVAAAPIAEQAALEPSRAEAPAEPPMGGPSPEEQAAAAHVIQPPHERADHAAAQNKSRQEARKARAARLARLARERRAAAPKARTAQARAKQRAAAPANSAPFGSFGNSGTDSWNTNTFGTNTFGR